MRTPILLLALFLFFVTGITFGQEIAVQAEAAETAKTEEAETTDSLASEAAKPLSKDEQKIAEWEALAAEAQAEADSLSAQAKSSPDPEAYHEVTKASLKAQKYQQKANDIKIKLQTAQRADALKEQKAAKKAEKSENKKKNKTSE